MPGVQPPDDQPPPGGWVVPDPGPGPVGNPATPPDPTEGLPQPWTVYLVDGKYFLIWDAPVGGDTKVPVGWEISSADFAAFFSDSINAHVSATMTMAQFEASGGIDAGAWAEIQFAADFWNDPLEGWLDALEENVVVAPWLADPEIAAQAAIAYVEGVSLSQAQLSNTEWWKSHNAAERAWLLLYSSDPATALQTLGDNRILAADLLTAAGINNADKIMVTVDGKEVALSQWLADKVTNGHWSQVFLEDQIDYLADPRQRRRLDEEITAALTGQLGQVNGTKAFQMKVEELYRTWLGPLYGTPEKSQIARWASKLRQDPDAETRLVNMLAGQRLALFPEYVDRSLTYEDIAGPWRNMGWQAWGEQLDETTPFFTEMVRANDASTAGFMLRSEGLRRGNGQVMSSLTSAFNNSFGGPIVRAE